LWKLWLLDTMGILLSVSVSRLWIEFLECATGSGLDFPG